MTFRAESANKVSILVNRCKNGDTRAFHELYELHVRAMLNVSARILNNKDDAEDVLQESFLKAFQGIQQFEEKVSFGSWLKRIVINRSIDMLRKKKVDFVPIDEAGHVELEISEEPASYEIETVRICINELPHGYRIVLSLYLLEDYTHKEIAEMLGISEGTSKSQYNRARKKLGEMIKLKSNADE